MGIRSFIIEDVLALRWCRTCYALMWRGHRAIHDKWHEHLVPADYLTEEGTVES